MRRILALAGSIFLALPVAAQQVTVEPVEFPSRDGKTDIKGYVFKTAGTAAEAPAVVMMHGRSGAYSGRASGKYGAETLSARHKAWGRLLARNGYVVVMVDDFGPVGYPGGFRAGTYKDRPAAVDEVANRPLHAYGALRYLQQQPDVDGDKVALLGWSNGGSATLAAMADDKPGDMRKIGFRAGVSIYPGCGLKNRFEKQGYRPYAPVQLFMGSADEEVSPASCEKLVARSRAKGGDITLTSFAGATHSYDTPIESRQSVKANADAKAATESAVLAFLARILKER